MAELSPLEKALLERGLDPGTYRRAFLLRHVESRIRALGLRSVERYPFYLKKNPDEFRLFLDSLAVNVTSFFRDAATFKALEAAVLPSLLRRKNGKLRLWSAGCATGQEAYSIAMIVQKVLTRMREKREITIAATDVKETALEKARRGEYTSAEMEGVKARFLEEFFEIQGGGYVVKPFLRERVRFSTHDLLKEKPLPGIDVLFCRNVLIYLERGAQLKLAEGFAESLVSRGFLVVGGSEVLPMETAKFFKVANLPGRVYQKAD